MYGKSNKNVSQLWIIVMYITHFFRVEFFEKKSYIRFVIYSLESPNDINYYLSHHEKNRIFYYSWTCAVAIIVWKYQLQLLSDIMIKRESRSPQTQRNNMWLRLYGFVVISYVPTNSLTVNIIFCFFFVPEPIPIPIQVSEWLTLVQSHLFVFGIRKLYVLMEIWILWQRINQMVNEQVTGKKQFRNYQTFRSSKDMIKIYNRWYQHPFKTGSPSKCLNITGRLCSKTLYKSKFCNKYIINFLGSLSS